MDKYFICILVVMTCMSVHLLIIGSTINTIEECLKTIARELTHRDVDDGK